MEWKTYDVSVGSTYSFKVGDIVQVRIKGGEPIYNSADGKTHSVQGTTGLIAQGAIVDTSVTSIDLVAPIIPPDDNGDNNYRPTIVLTLNPISLTAKNFTNPVDDILVDSTKIQVLRQEITSAKNKIVVTKEKLAYYHNKVKSLLDAKGTVKKVNYAGQEYTPDTNGIVNLPDSIPDMGHDSTTEQIYLKYYTKEDQSTIWDENRLVFDHGTSTDCLTVNFVKAGVQSFSVLLPNKSYVDDKAAACSTLKFQKVSAVPNAATAEDGIIYLVENTSAGTNVYDEYFRVNKGDTTTPNYVMELFGTTAVDLTDYLQETDITEISNAEIDEIVTPATP